VHIRLIAVGDRQPAWVEEAVESYARRLPMQWRFRLQTVTTAGDKDSRKRAASEGERVLGQVRPAERVVVLDEKGRALSSTAFAAELEGWLADGRDLAFVIGGPDGVSADCLKRADFRWSLSPMTLPHGLARVLAVEQLYRAWTLAQGHPYHRV
jgi:23S rRNA (pseudouridine1915-N3)-methyltransferase